MTATSGITTSLTDDRKVLEDKQSAATAAQQELDRLLVLYFQGETVTEDALGDAQQSAIALKTESERLKTEYVARGQESLKDSKLAYDTATTALTNAINLFKSKGEGLASLRGLKSAADTAKSEYESARDALGLGKLTSGSTPSNGQGGWRGINTDPDNKRGISNGSVAHSSVSGSSGKNAYVLRLDASGRLLRHFPTEHVYESVLAHLRGVEDQGRAFVAVNALESTRKPASKGRIAVYCDRTVARILRPTLVALSNGADKPVANSCRKHVLRIDEYLALTTDQLVAQSGSDKGAPETDEDETPE